MVSAFFVASWQWLAQAPFHEDEAIYAAWSLGIARGDWLLWQIPVDKPPLTFYPLAAVMALGARTEWLVRVPTFFWGLLALWGVGRLAERLERHGWIAQATVLVSPLWWAMWASAFTDMAAVALGVWGIGEWIGGGGKRNAESGNGANGTQDAGRRNGIAEQFPVEGDWRQGRITGVLIGLAILAKPTMVLWLPLVLTSLFSSDTKGKTVPHPPAPFDEGGNGDPHQAPVSSPVPLGRGKTATHPPTPSLEGENDNRNWLLFFHGEKWRGGIEGFAGVMLLAWAWDASRIAPSWWRLGAEAYGTLGRGWGEWVAWGWLAVGALGMSVGYGMLNREMRKEKGDEVALKDKNREIKLPFLRPASRVLRSAFRVPRSIFSWMILLWIPIHVWLGFQPWERYLLPLLALVAIQLAPERETESGKARKSPRSAPPSPLFFLFSPFAFLLIIAPFLVAPLQFAPQDGRWNGIREVGAVIEALPPGSEVWYGAMGRPLAWYGAEANAELKWAGVAWQAFPGCAPGRYIAARQDESLPTGLELLAKSGDFGVWQCKGP